MRSFKDFQEEQGVSPNTIVVVSNDAGNQIEVKSVGMNATSFLRPGSGLTGEQVEELKRKGWKIRYADNMPAKSDGPKSSGKAGEPQKD